MICSAIVVGNQRFPLGSLSNIRLIERAFRVVRLVVGNGEVAVPGGDLHGFNTIRVPFARHFDVVVCVCVKRSGFGVRFLALKYEQSEENRTARIPFHTSPITNLSPSRSSIEISLLASIRIRSRISSTKILLSIDKSSYGFFLQPSSASTMSFKIS